MIRFITASVIIACSLLSGAIPHGKVRAQQLFNFSQEGTGDTLAKLEIFNLPASGLADFGELTLTPEGVLLFGVVTGSYTGEFEFTSVTPEWSVDNVGGELVANSSGAFIEDIHPPRTTATDLRGQQPSTFSVGFATADLPSSIGFIYPEFATFTVNGRFLAVPEPHTAGLVVVAIACGICGMHRRKRCL